MSVDTFTLRMRLNGQDVEIDVPPYKTLASVLRDRLMATEVKEGCGEGVCGACTVLLDGRAVNACTTLAVQAHECSVVTLRGIADGELHGLQKAFLENGAAQCGFCTPGMVMTLLDYLERHPLPSREEIRAAISGNLCRCTGYKKIIDAVEDYVARRRGDGAPGAADEMGGTTR